MAEIKQGILGGISGKVGTVVGANWRGKNIIRALPRKTKKKPSQLQLNQRNRFKLVSTFLQPLNRLLGRYFGVGQGIKSRANLALAYHLREAVLADGENVAIQLERVLLSKGILPSLTEQTATVENGRLSLSWAADVGRSLGHPSDLLTVVVYEEQTDSFQIFDKVTTRGARSFSTALGVDQEDAVFSIWLFLTNVADTECSTSIFMHVNHSAE